MHQRRTRLAGIAFVAALAAGFGIGMAQDTARAASEFKMGMLGSSYGPKLLRVKIGDTIVFTNDDVEDHWVFVPTLGFQISRANQKPGESFRYLAMKAGTFDVECALHVDMSARVIVER